MPGTLEQGIELFYSYACVDKDLRDKLETCLSGLKRQYHLIHWSDNQISPGENWEQIIDIHLRTAHLILLLISPDFVVSDHYWVKEMAKALERHDAGDCRVIPILLRPIYLEETPFSSLQMLPDDGKPITLWPNEDAAFANVARGIAKAIKELLVSWGNQWLTKGDVLYNLKEYEEALLAFDQAIRLIPNDAIAYMSKGRTLAGLKEYEEALNFYELAIRLDPSIAVAAESTKFAEVLSQCLAHRDTAGAAVNFFATLVKNGYSQKMSLLFTLLSGIELPEYQISTLLKEAELRPEESAEFLENYGSKLIPKSTPALQSLIADYFNRLTVEQIGRPSTTEFLGLLKEKLGPESGENLSASVQSWNSLNQFINES